MKLFSRKNKISTFLTIVLIVGQFGLVGSYLFIPKQAEACLAILGFSAGACTILDIPRTIEHVVSGIAERIAVNYANKYLTKFVQQVSDKYRIKDFLYYDQYLSDYYLSNLILKNVSDPNLRQAFGIMNSLYVTGQFQAFCNKNGPSGETYRTEADCLSVGGAWKDPRSALIPALKQSMTKIYLDQGGVASAKIYYPSVSMSDRDYFAAARTYYANPPSFTEQNLQGQFGAFQSNATTAAQLEVTVGNGLKAGRIIGGTCSNQTDSVDWGNTNNGKGWDPVSCAAAGGKWNASLLDQARNLITNPTAFIDKNIDGAINSVFKGNFDPSNPFTQIGQALGDFLFSKLDLNTSASTLNDGGNYNPNNYNSSATDAETLKRQVDLDGDGIPDGQNNTNPFNPKDGCNVSAFPTCVSNPQNKAGWLTDPSDACYHGGVPDKPPGCSLSSKTQGSSYFAPFCKATEDAYDQLAAWVKFQEDHQYQIKGGGYGSGVSLVGALVGLNYAAFTGGIGILVGLLNPFSKDETDFDDNGKSEAQIWGQQASVVESKMNTLADSFADLKLTNTNADRARFTIATYDNYIGLVANRLFSNGDTDHIGNFKDGFKNLHNYTAQMLYFVASMRVSVTNCSDPKIGNLPSVSDFSVPPAEKIWPCTQLGIDEKNFMLPLLNDLKMSPQEVVDKTNTQFDAQITAAGETGAQYYPIKVGDKAAFPTETIGLPEFYLAEPDNVPHVPGDWFVVFRCSNASTP